MSTSHRCDRRDNLSVTPALGDALGRIPPRDCSIGNVARHAPSGVLGGVSAPVREKRSVEKSDGRYTRMMIEMMMIEIWSQKRICPTEPKRRIKMNPKRALITGVTCQDGSYRRL